MIKRKRNPDDEVPPVPFYDYPFYNIEEEYEEDIDPSFIIGDVKYVGTRVINGVQMDIWKFSELACPDDGRYGVKKLKNVLYGQPAYIVRSTEEDFRKKISIRNPKRKRNPNVSIEDLVESMISDPYGISRKTYDILYNLLDYGRKDEILDWLRTNTFSKSDRIFLTERKRRGR